MCTMHKQHIWPWHTELDNVTCQLTKKMTNAQIADTEMNINRDNNIITVSHSVQ